jgi:hypothetical protein
MKTLEVLAAAAETGIPASVIAAIATSILLALIIWFSTVRARRAHSSVLAEEGTILAVTALPTRPVLSQVAALRPAFGAGKPPRNGFQRPVAVLDASELRLTLNGSASTAYLTIPRTAITGVQEFDARDRLMRARAIRLTISGPTSLPLDLIPLDPVNPSTVASSTYFDSLLVKLRNELHV